MNRMSRLLTSAVAATALVGSASAAANACDRPGPDGTQPFTQLAHHRHHHLTFAQRKALILAQLTRADGKLSSYISSLTPAAQADPNGWQAQAVANLQRKQARLEAVIAAVRAATTDRQIADAFRSAFGSVPTSPRWDRA